MKKPIILISSIAAAAILITAVLLLINRKMNREYESFVEEVPVRVNDTVSIDGLYTIRISKSEGESCTTAKIKREDDGYKLTILSDYLPEEYSCKMVEDGVLHSDKWGDGTVTYRPATGTIIIKLNFNETTKCELSK